MRFVISVLLGLACAACSADQGTVSQSTQAEEVSENVVANLTGIWSVAEIDGKTRLKFPIEIKGNDKRLWWEPQCAGQEINYRAVENGLTEFFDPNANESQVVCDIGFQEDLPRVWQSVQGPRSVTISEDGTATITGEGRRLVLEPIKPDDLATLAGEWRVAGIDGRALNGPNGLALSANDSEIWWEPRCARIIAGYTISGSRFHVAGPPPQSPPHPPGVDVLPPAVVCTIGLPPNLSDAMGAVRAGEKIERTLSNGVRISGGGRSITLFSQ